MNRETIEHFGAIPKIHTERSRFDRSHSHSTSFNDGEIIPIYVDEILPGDTVDMDVAEVVRMATPIYPVMDNMIMDIMFFFVPNRLLWEHWEEFWGQNDDPWIQQQEYEIPQIEAPNGGWETGTIADYMGIATYVDNKSVNALFFRAYAKIWSDWFRDENLKSASHVYLDDTTRTGSNGGNYVTDPELGGKPLKAAKLHDRFTSCLPNPQRGPAVSVPLGSTAPLKSKNENIDFRIHDPNGYYTDQYAVLQNEYIMTSGTPVNLVVKQGNSASSDIPAGYRVALNDGNFYTDLRDATASTISQLRTAFAIQKYYENAGRGGTRYIEYLRSVFGVESSDARLQRSEYLGGQRIPINMDQIVQTSATDAVTPQGNTAGLSVTAHSDSYFTKSFEEHGILIGVAVTRTEKTYQQGIHKKFLRKKWTDFYNPFFAFLSEQGIKNEEIYAQGDDVLDRNGNIIDKQIFGYQEAWAEYRSGENRVSGMMRSNTPGGGLDAWHYADNYNALPTLGSTWIDEDKSVVDRTIAVQSQRAHQLIGDFYFKTKYTRPMPVYSIPGLIDHV